MNWTEWTMNLIVSIGSGAIGFVAGQMVHWRRHPDSFFVVAPTVRGTQRTQRLGAMLVALLAVVTVASSTVTSIQVRQQIASRAEADAEQRECNRSLTERLAIRAEITENDHQNTTDFVIEVQQAMAAGPGTGSYPRIVEAADRYVERQDRLAEAKQNIPLDEHACR